MSEQKRNKLSLWYHQPAKKWTQALPLGNGRIGAMVFGGIEKERIGLNEDTLWSGYPVDTIDPMAGDYIRKAADLVKEGKPLEAQWLLEDHVVGTWGQSYMPLGDIELSFDHHGEIKNYRRVLDLQTAITTVEYTCHDVDYKRECFVSAPDDGVVLRLTASKDSQINFCLSMQSQLKSVITASENTLMMEGECPGQAAPNYVEIENPIIYSEEPEKKGIHFYGMVKLTHRGGFITRDGELLRLTGANEATIYFTVKTSFHGFDKHPYLEGKETRIPCEEAMKVLSSKTYDMLCASHLEDYQTYFNRVEFDLHTELEVDLPTDLRLRRFARGEKDNGLYPLLFQFGRYLLIASSRPNTQAANLQGIWNEELRAPWSSNYTVNINTEMNYWPAFTCNLGELNEPLLQLVKDISKKGKETARVYYNARGFTAHHNIDLWRITTPVGPRGNRSSAKWGFWPMGAAWLCLQVYEQFKFTGDLRYAKEEAMPLLKEASLFCLDILSPNKEGYLIACPSTSPENEYFVDGKECGVALTSAMTMTIIQNLFHNSIELCEVLGEEVELNELLKETLPKLYPNRIGSRGHLLEWNDDLEGTDPHHRHISHLYGLHPANEFTYDKAPEFMEACKVTLQERGDDGTGWSLGWKVNQWARLRDGDHALKLVKRQLQPVEDEEVNYKDHGGTYDNLFDAHPPFQIDGNFGVTAGIAEMLLQSHEGYLHLLPALPMDWNEGIVKGLVGRGNVIVDLKWQEGVLLETSMTSKSDGLIQVKYQDRIIKYQARAGETIRFNCKLHEITK
ncbi:MAG: hypothetical protein K0S47_3391 [Herbinix sp.]|jgi:alpha-L-fucosidase 2|nr:hypothetical protein [Herbinix sp.]